MQLPIVHIIPQRIEVLPVAQQTDLLASIDAFLEGGAARAARRA